MYRISVQEEGRSQMSVESNMMKVDSEKIKEVLRHHNELTQQIHNQVIDIRKKIDEVEQQSLEMASYPKIDLSATGSGSGIHKDLADVYLNYQRLVKTQERELTDEMLTLIASARGIHRLYLCFQSLSGDEYNIVFVPSRGFLFFYPISYSPYKSRAIFIICGANIFKPSECYF